MTTAEDLAKLEAIDRELDDALAEARRAVAKYTEVARRAKAMARDESLPLQVRIRAASRLLSRSLDEGLAALFRAIGG